MPAILLAAWANNPIGPALKEFIVEDPGTVL